MRYVIYGAGAVGGTIGGELSRHGREAVLIARGDHLREIRRNGLSLDSPEGKATIRLPAFGSYAEAGPRDDDVVVLSVKTQDTAYAVEELAAAGDPDLPLFCAQNGVENERIALRRFPRVYGVYVYIFGTHLVPGRVQRFTSPAAGLLDLGRYPRGTDDLLSRVSEDLRSASFEVMVRDDIMAWKYAKLLTNLVNALQAVCDDEEVRGSLYARARSEALACYEAAGVRQVSADDVSRRLSAVLPLGQIDGAPFPGGSSWQSLARGVGSIESDFLNGEIVLLGRISGVPTPVNETLQRAARLAAVRRMGPGAFSTDQLLDMLGSIEVGATPVSCGDQGW